MLANWITLSRFPILVTTVLALYLGSPTARVAGVALLFVGLMLDTVDGAVARRTGRTTLFGGVLDIAADRTYELVLWVCFADLRLIPTAIPLVVLVRTTLTDALRAIGIGRGEAPVPGRLVLDANRVCRRQDCDVLWSGPGSGKRGLPDRVRPGARGRAAACHASSGRVADCGPLRRARSARDRWLAAAVWARRFGAHESAWAPARWSCRWNARNSWMARTTVESAVRIRNAAPRGRVSTA